MIAQMSFHLALRLVDESEARRVIARGGEHADQEAAGVPEWIEHAGSTAELLDALRAPLQVIALLASRGVHSRRVAS